MAKRTPDRRSKSAAPKRRLSRETRVTSGFVPKISDSAEEARENLERDPAAPPLDEPRTTSGFVARSKGAPSSAAAPSAASGTLPSATTRRSAELSALVLDEIQSPLLVALARLDSVSGDPSASSELRAAARDAQAMVEASRRLLLDFVDVTSSEAGGLTPRSERTDLGRLVTDTCMALAEVASRKRVILDISASPRGSSAWFDPRLTRRILRNLVLHAVQNGTEGSTVTVRAQTTRGQVACSVQHDGEEVSARVCTAAFDKFSKLDEAHPVVRQSPGLSLHFCRVAVDALRGRLWMEPLEPRGARLWFTIPAP